MMLNILDSDFSTIQKNVYTEIIGKTAQLSKRLKMDRRLGIFGAES